MNANRRFETLGRIGLAATLVALLATTDAGMTPLLANPARDGGQEASARRHVEFLADDGLGGRLTGTEDARRARDYIVAQLEQMGFHFTAAIPTIVRGKNHTVKHIASGGPTVQIPFMTESGNFWVEARFTPT